jgi:hypothetical protein
MATKHILSCGVFQKELEQILPDIKSAIPDSDFVFVYVEPALHDDNDKLKAGIDNALEPIDEKISAFLFGFMCHPDLPQIAAAAGAVCPKQEKNCMELFLAPELKAEFDKSGNIYYMTEGWVKMYLNDIQTGQGWDPIDARINFGSFDKIVILDTGFLDVSDEELFELYEYTDTPIEIESISLDYFKKSIIDLCLR